ncbi:MAG: hypothetical protein JEY97_06175 [Bacteroidales bacterium]|nr:hypothetical protein [Bacteroidales bacterium]
MLETIIDHKILEDFFINKKPEKKENDNDEKKEKLEEELEIWDSFEKFLKKGTSLQIANTPKKETPFYFQKFTSGMDDNKTFKRITFNKPKNNKFPAKTKPETLFFLFEKDEKEKKKYLKNNGYFIAFKDNYLSKWKDLSFHKKEKQLQLLKNKTEYEKFWKDFTKSLLPLTDIIIIDNYLFADINLVEPNLIKIFECIFKICGNTTLNLLIITSGNDKNIDQKFWSKQTEAGINEVEKNKLENIGCFLERLFQEFGYNKKIKFGIVFTNIKHARHVFMNYLRFKSDDSLTFFNENKTLKTKEAEIEFFPYVDYVQEYYIKSQNILVGIKKNIEKINKGQKHHYGNINNNLLINVKTITC